MTSNDPVELLFGGMGKLGPGADADTLHVLELLPTRRFPLIVDAGSGAGRQTLVLARALGTVIHAVDVYEPFLRDLTRRATDAQLGHLVDTTCVDMSEIPTRFSNIDLLWSEGAAYNIGFSHALTIWAPAIKQGGFAVVSELSWLRDAAPKEVRDFFRTGYPAMQSVDSNLAVAERAGYRALGTYTLPRGAWMTDYYDVLRPRAEALASHADPQVSSFAVETLQEIETFERSAGSYGYVFFILERA